MLDPATGKIEQPNQLYKPDPEFPFLEGDANAPNNNNYQPMKLLNYKNCHFNLIVNKEHMLVKQKHCPEKPENPANVPKSIDKRKGGETKEPEHKREEEKEPRREESKESQKDQNYLCTECSEKYTNKSDIDSHMKGEHKDAYIRILENKIKEVEASRELAQKGQQQCEDNVCKLTEDIEKLKIVNKELSSLKKTKKAYIPKSPGDDYDQLDEVELDSEKELIRAKQSGFRRSSPMNQATQMFTCTECNSTLKDKISLEEHLKNHKKSQLKCPMCEKLFKEEGDLKFHRTYEHMERSQWNCMDCSFQSHNKELLKNHVNIRHTKDSEKIEVECDECDKKFRSSWNLKNHIRDDHGKKQDCSFYRANRCNYGNSCWNLHNDSPNTELFTCFSCKEGFNTLNGLMSHRKKKHVELLKQCKPKSGSCRFENNPDRCWFIHGDFRKVLKHQVPPGNSVQSSPVRLNESIQSSL